MIDEYIEDMPITASQIQRIVAAEDDFGHELRVGAVLRSIANERSVHHGGTYFDPNLNKPRQFDFVCYLRREGVSLCLAVECKNINPDYPVVICGVKRLEHEAFHELISCTGYGEITKFRGQIINGPCSFTQRVRVSRFYPVGGFVGKSVIPLKAESRNSSNPVAGPDGEVYDRWSQALSSGIVLAHAAPREKNSRAIKYAVLPIVVLSNGSLWTVEYDENGQALAGPNQVDDCSFYISRSTSVGFSPGPHTFTFSHLHFCTLDGLARVLTKLWQNEDYREQLFDPEAVII